MIHSNSAQHVKAKLHEATGLYSSIHLSLCGPAEQSDNTNLHESFLSYTKMQGMLESLEIKGKRQHTFSPSH